MKPSLFRLQNIIISRTDSIGDVVLTLPLAKLVKETYPHIKVAFLGRAYTKPVIDACTYIDQFIDIEDFLKQEILIDGKPPQAIIHVFPVKEIAHRAKAIGIPWRIGTTNRLYHWTTCNKRVRLSRKKSDLHEAQLNAKLLAPLALTSSYNLQRLGDAMGMTRLQPLPTAFQDLLDPDRYRLILHPKSQGSAREWGLDHFISLVNILPLQQFQIFISGTAKERESLQYLFKEVGDRVTDITGKMDLSTFISFIDACDGLVANSTGPLHISAALGKKAIGIYPPIRPMHPGRWQPLGKNATYSVVPKDCNDCRKDPGACHCIREVLPQQIAGLLIDDACLK